MKIKVFLLVIFSMLFMTACSPKKETFNDLFKSAVNNYHKLNSYTIDEASHMNFTVNVADNTQDVQTGMTENYNYIADPLYVNDELTQKISTTNIVNNLLILQDNDQYDVYTRINGAAVNKTTVSKTDLKDLLTNDELDTTLNRVPTSVKQKSETKNAKKQNIITYTSTFKLSDLKADNQDLFDSILTTYIDSKSHSTLMNIDITETIVINESTKQFEKISYDLSDFLSSAYSNSPDAAGTNYTISNVDAQYSFTFSNFNHVTKNTDLKDQVS